MSTVARRKFLLGLGGIAFALPFLETFAPRRAYAAPAPAKRFISFFHHHGTVMSQWSPKGSGANMTLPTILQPLEPHKSRILVIGHTDNKVSPLNKNTNGHNGSARSALTCQPFASAVDASGALRPAEMHIVDDHANGPSIDQALAARIRGTTRYKSIDVGIGAMDSARRHTSKIFYAGKNDPVTSLMHPQDVFDRLFAGSSQSGDALAKLRARRQSVLDAVNESFAGLRGRVGKDDRERLDAHAQKVRDLEQRMLAPAPVCATPTMNLRKPDWRQSGEYNYVSDDDITAPIQIDLLVMALSCGLTNVGTIYFGSSEMPTFPWIPGAPVVTTPKYNAWHDMVHKGHAYANGGVEDPGLVKGYRWYYEQLAYLLKALTTMQDPAGAPLLDSTCVLSTSDFGDGAGHNTQKLPIVLAGNTGGTTGRYLGDGPPTWVESAYAHSQVMVSILNAFGFPDRDFGHPGIGSGPLPGIAT